MYKNCASCQRFYEPNNDDKMCIDCKKEHERVKNKLFNNPNILAALKGLANK